MGEAGGLQVRVFVWPGSHVHSRSYPRLTPKAPLCCTARPCSYVNICRSLFERHKLMFSLLLAVKILQHQKYINAQEWR